MAAITKDEKISLGFLKFPKGIMASETLSKPNVDFVIGVKLDLQKVIR